MRYEGSNADLIEVNEGVVFKVALKWLPRVGDRILVSSLREAKARFPLHQHFQVTEIVHELTDVPKSGATAADGIHHVKVVVAPASKEKLKRRPKGKRK